MDAITLFQESDTDKDMASAALRQSRIPGVSGDELRTLQDLQVVARTRLKELGYASQAGDADPAEVAALERKSREAFQQLEAHTVRLQRQAPSLGRAVSAEAPAVQEIQSRLDADEAQLIVAPHADGTVAMLVTKTSVTHKALPLTQSRASELVAGIRRSVTFEDGKDIGPFDTRSAAALYNELLGWAQPQLVGVKRANAFGVCSTERTQPRGTLLGT